MADMRNVVTAPMLEEFAGLVKQCYLRLLPAFEQDVVVDFFNNAVAQQTIRAEYAHHLRQFERGELTAESFSGSCAVAVADALVVMFG